MSNSEAVSLLMNNEYYNRGYKQGYKQGVSDVLDKIKAEIQNLRNCSCSCSDGIIDDVEDIIDKYKAESEAE